MFKKLFPELIWNIPDKEKNLYLTFDDGPTPEVTPWVLSVLKEFDAKATFFCLGKNVEKYPDIFNNILAQGHSVGNHSYTHLNGWKTKNSIYYQDIEKAQKLIKTDLFRPPYGRIKPSQIKTLKKKYKLIMWDVLSKDYHSKISNEKCLNNVISCSKNGSIIVFHDFIKAKKNLFYVLPKVLEHFHKQGFCFCLINLSPL